MRFTVVTEPTAEVLTSADPVLRQMMRLEDDETDQDALIDSLCVVARQKIEDHTGRRLLTQTVEGLRDCFPGHDSAMELPIGPIQSVSSLEYAQESDGAFVALDAEFWRFAQSSEPGQLEPAYEGCWPFNEVRDQTASVRVTLIVGYGDDAQSLPAPLLHALRMYVAHLYQHREDTDGDLPPIIHGMIDPAYTLWFSGN